MERGGLHASRQERQFSVGWRAVGAELHPLFAAGGTGGQQDSVKETPDFAVSLSSVCKQPSKVLNVCRFHWDFSKTKAGKPGGVIQKTHFLVQLTLEVFKIYRPVKLPQS